ncbi:MAG: hypothetical protein ACYC5N_11810, partial [Endomicrobiales bacterium]
MQVGSSPDTTATAFLNALGMKAFSIRAAAGKEELSGHVLIGKVLVPEAGGFTAVKVYARRVDVKDGSGGETRRTWVLSLYAGAARPEGTDGALFLGRGALAVMSEIQGNPEFRRRLRRLGLELGKDFNADIIEASGAGAAFAHPRAVNDDYGESFSRSLFVFNVSGNGLERTSAKNGEEDIIELVLQLSDEVTGDGALTKKYGWLEGRTHHRDNGFEDGEQTVKDRILAVYAPGVTRKYAESVTAGLTGLAEVVPATALRGRGLAKDPGCGKITDLSGYVAETLMPAGINIVQFTPLSAPDSTNLFAGDALLVDWKSAAAAHRMLESGEITESELSVQGNGEYVEREKLSGREYGVAEKLYAKLKDDAAFKKYCGAEENREWLEKAAQAAEGAPDAAALERARGVFKLTQWLFDMQLREELARIKKAGGKALFSLDIRNAGGDEVLKALEHWFNFGFEGVMVISDGKAMDGRFLEALKKLARRSSSAPVVSVRLTGEAPREVAKRIEDAGFMVVRDLSAVKTGKVSPGESEAVYVDTLKGAPAEASRKADFYLEAARSAVLSRAGCVFFKIGMLHGEEVDLDDPQVRAAYRVPRAGEARHAFGRDFARQWKEVMRLRRSDYESAYASGFNLATARKTQARETSRETVITLDYGKGDVRTLRGTGLHALFAAHELMRSAREQGRTAAQYHSDEYFFPKAYEALDMSKEPPAEEAGRAIAGYVRNLEKNAAASSNEEDRILCVDRLMGFLRGLAEGSLEARYKTARPVPESEEDRRALRALLLLADALGISIEELARAQKEGIAPPQEAGTALSEAAITASHVTAQTSRTAVSLEPEARKAAGEFLARITREPETLAASLAGETRQARVWAITELLKVFDLFAPPALPAL